ncbi:helix-turn-helix domain-containing protein [Pediococcus acidilactici]|uniref:helix-turn-helix domain-containing protein n=1 Tax=Pediococcus acidilactici TaxID=1254 RepID=UPI0013205A5F|nr:helix-turn-helix transcriptional regulator [Pediococcus acidilactici]KAF0334484.1 helix-turn-helix domain-containing protein [Pediococcus acidilactici]KAF0393889.1 helix-turn-helix domain-containing protein [Pediococcus acidilactici]KAF0398112.1 helix-turn-helix domain-containing protein [Pediococcus acidilactici]KAF0410268.1 helix-turn-helix domain-containing protein [Pediococcus acidilactici]KAF0435615.1 helix-turn-helix domain-containing protein [Pediococcus acidilactici]
MDRLKALRESSGLSLTQLSKETGISVSSLSAYERGTRQPKSEIIQILSTFFDVIPGYLTGKTESKTPTEFLKKKINFTRTYKKSDISADEFLEYLSNAIKEKEDQDLSEALGNSFDEILDDEVQKEIAKSILDYKEILQSLYLKIPFNKINDSNKKAIEILKKDIKTKVLKNTRRLNHNLTFLRNLRLYEATPLTDSEALCQIEKLKKISESLSKDE